MGYFAICYETYADKHPDLPRPGSFLAEGQGCMCDPVENQHGAGLWQGSPGDPIYYINDECPMHKDLSIYLTRRKHAL